MPAGVLRERRSCSGDAGGHADDGDGTEPAPTLLALSFALLFRDEGVAGRDPEEPRASLALPGRTDNVFSPLDKERG